MHLVRRYVPRKTKRYRTYLYIRRSAYKCVRLSPDIPLGRMDRKEPKKTVERWLESSENLPNILRGRLTRGDVMDLYEAIQDGDSWVVLERWNAYLFPKQDPRFEWGKETYATAGMGMDE